MRPTRKDEKKPARGAEVRKPKGPGAGVPADLVGFEMDLRRSERVQTVEVLKTGRTPLTVIEVADRATATAEEAVGRVKETYPPPPLACREGCDWCCYFAVGTTVPEVARIVAYLRQTLSPEEFVALRERVGRLAEQRRAGPPPERGGARLPCALLVEHRCVAYPVRPLTCRGFNSRDAHRCEQSVTSRGKIDVPLYVPQQRLTTFALDGVIAGLAQAGLPADRLELTAALRIILEDPGAVERWLAGAPVFAPARFL
jgi:Fe-S-cluster containining protein